MSPPHYVGYDDDPLPPDRFRMSFGPPKRQPKRQPAPVPVAPPRPVIAPPRPQMVAETPAEAPAPATAVRRVAEARPARVLRPQLEPRGQQVHSFPTWKPLPAPVVRLPAHPVAAVAAVTSGLQGWRLAAFRLLAALVLLAPLGWFGGWFGLPATAVDFLMTGLGRAAWRLLGGPDAMALYWVLLFPPALGLTFARVLAWPLAGLALLFWAWTGLQHGLGMPGPWVPW